LLIIIYALYLLLHYILIFLLLIYAYYYAIDVYYAYFFHDSIYFAIYLLYLHYIMHYCHYYLYAIIISHHTPLFADIFILILILFTFFHYDYAMMPLMPFLLLTLFIFSLYFHYFAITWWLLYYYIDAITPHCRQDIMPLFISAIFHLFHCFILFFIYAIEAYDIIMMPFSPYIITPLLLLFSITPLHYLLRYYFHLFHYLRCHWLVSPLTLLLILRFHYMYIYFIALWDAFYCHYCHFWLLYLLDIIWLRYLHWYYFIFWYDIYCCAIHYLLFYCHYFWWYCLHWCHYHCLHYWYFLLFIYWWYYYYYYYCHYFTLHYHWYLFIFIDISFIIFIWAKPLHWWWLRDTLSWSLAAIAYAYAITHFSLIVITARLTCHAAISPLLHAIMACDAYAIITPHDACHWHCRLFADSHCHITRPLFRYFRYFHSLILFTCLRWLRRAIDMAITCISALLLYYAYYWYLFTLLLSLMPLLLRHDIIMPLLRHDIIYMLIILLPRHAIYWYYALHIIFAYDYYALHYYDAWYGHYILYYYWCMLMPLFIILLPFSLRFRYSAITSYFRHWYFIISFIYADYAIDAYAISPLIIFLLIAALFQMIFSMRQLDYFRSLPLFCVLMIADWFIFASFHFFPMAIFISIFWYFFFISAIFISYAFAWADFRWFLSPCRFLIRFDVSLFAMLFLSLLMRFLSLISFIYIAMMIRHAYCWCAMMLFIIALRHKML